jgi:hypothetical protein
MAKMVRPNEVGVSVAATGADTPNDQTASERLRMFVGDVLVATAETVGIAASKLDKAIQQGKVRVVREKL